MFSPTADFSCLSEHSEFNISCNVFAVRLGLLLSTRLKDCSFIQVNSGLGRYLAQNRPIWNITDYFLEFDCEWLKTNLKVCLGLGCCCCCLFVCPTPVVLHSPLSSFTLIFFWKCYELMSITLLKLKHITWPAASLFMRLVAMVEKWYCFIFLTCWLLAF